MKNRATALILSTTLSSSYAASGLQNFIRSIPGLSQVTWQTCKKPAEDVMCGTTNQPQSVLRLELVKGWQREFHTEESDSKTTMYVIGMWNNEPYDIAVISKEQEKTSLVVLAGPKSKLAQQSLASAREREAKDGIYHIFQDIEAQSADADVADIPLTDCHRIKPQNAFYSKLIADQKLYYQKVSSCWFKLTGGTPHITLETDAGIKIYFKDTDLTHYDVRPDLRSIK